MTSDDRGWSLADQAASWVPPWERAAPAEPAPQAEGAESDDDATPAEPAPQAEGAESGADATPGGDDAALGEVDAAAADSDVGEAWEAAATAEADDAAAIDEADEAYADSLADEAAEPLVDGGSAVSVEEPFDATLAGAVPPDVVPRLAEEADAVPAADEAAEPLVGGGFPVSEEEPFDATLADAVLPEAVPQPAEQTGPLALVGDEELRGALEAILLVVEEPVSEVTLAQVLEQPTERITELLGELAGEYESSGRGFELRRAAGGWRFYTRPEYAQYVERFVLDGQQLRLTQAALETLAVVAYKQPVTRSRISAIRGVNCDGVIRTLVSRGLVEECGAEPDSGAFLYRTTTLFLEKLGLNSVEELPPLAPFLPDDVDEIADAPR